MAESFLLKNDFAVWASFFFSVSSSFFFVLIFKKKIQSNTVLSESAKNSFTDTRVCFQSASLISELNSKMEMIVLVVLQQWWHYKKQAFMTIRAAESQADVLHEFA